ncbi:hypothetical protein C8R43DRAFT_1142496 [Mycena crocata]|nr:hypothetical protein C8R43DRAFT_1142496 [Mycena crocata]
MGVITTSLPRLAFTEASSLGLVRIMTLAIRWNDSGLADTVLLAWERLIQKGVNPARFIAIFEERGSNLERFTVSITGCDGLSETQISRLMIGRRSLANECLSLPNNPPPLPRAATCTPDSHKDGCLVDWNRVWNDCANTKGVLRLDSADILGRLNASKSGLPPVENHMSHVAG